MNRPSAVALLLLAALPGMLADKPAWGQTGRDCHDVQSGECDFCPSLYDELRGVGYGLKRVAARLVDEATRLEAAGAAAVYAGRIRGGEGDVYGYPEDECGGHKIELGRSDRVGPGDTVTQSFPLDYCLSGHDACYDATVYGAETAVPLSWQALVDRGIGLAGSAWTGLRNQDLVLSAECYVQSWLEQLECEGYPVRWRQWELALVRMEARQPSWEQAESPSFRQYDDVSLYGEDDCMGYVHCNPLDEQPELVERVPAEVAPAVARSIDASCGRPLLLGLAEGLDQLSVVLQDASRGLTRFAARDLDLSAAPTPAQR